MTAQHTAGRRTAQTQISELRRAAAEHSLLAFAKTYLPAHFRLPPSSMHHELVSMLEQATTQRGARLAIAAPRGHAKSTITCTAYLLWCVCYRKEPFILLISNALDQATDSLSQVKTELQSNTRLLEDFPEVCEIPGEHRGAPRWRKDEIITRNGVKVSALGAGTKIRGRRHQQHRPTLILLDDIESDEEVRSEDMRRFKAEWFQKAVLKAGNADTNVVVVGTILHYDALLANLTDPRKSAGWEGRRYRAVIAWSKHPDLWSQWESIYNHLEQYKSDNGPAAAQQFLDRHRTKMLKGTKVLWPELEEYPALMELRIREGRASFDSEKQNEPINPEDCYFQESDFVFWDDQYGSAEELIASVNGSFYGACDPSMGKRGRGADDSAIITLLRDHETGVLYVVDADIRRRKPDRIIQDIIEYDRLRDYVQFAMETNQFQEFLSQELQRRSAEAGVYVSVDDIHHSTDKLGRIQSLQPLVRSGTLRLSRRHVTLLDQLRQFPLAAHDDGPDALEMAVSTSRVRPVTITGLSLDDDDDDEPYDPIDDDRLWTRCW